MNKNLLIATLMLALAPAIQASPLTFDFKDPKGVNNVVFKLDAPLESINGTANGISGTVTVDPEDLTTAKGKIVVATESLTVPISMMREHMLSPGWLDAKANPEISFELKSLSEIQKEGTASTATAAGTFTLKGVSKEISVPVTITYLPGKLADRTGGKMQGDLIVLRAHFQINRSDYGIKPGQNADTVSEVIDISLAVAGSSPKS